MTKRRGIKLIEVYPEVAQQFASALNNGLSPHELTVGSRHRIWWKCDKGLDHVWQASPNQRTSGGKLRGCPVCAGKNVVASTSLATTHPELLNEWDREQNDQITPHDVTAGSNIIVWWRCPEASNHVWQASIKSRTKKNNKCPVCQSIAFKYPKYAAEIHPTRNVNLDPYHLSFSSHSSIWWKCPKGPDHIWETSPNRRTSNLAGCPICAGYKVVKSNSLATTHPKISAQWYYEKNASMEPTDVHAGSHRYAWWKCEEAPNHIWSAQIKSRTVNNLGCPFCSGRRVTVGNSLATQKPQMTELWHPIKNLPLKPTEVTPYSNRLVWWRCPQGDDHEWQATVANIVNGSTCPICMGRKITATNNLFVLHPDLTEEWDFEENTEIDPWKISPGSKQKVWWVCKRDIEHRWYATIKDRTDKGSGCPYCAERLNLHELQMLEIIKQTFPTEDVFYRAKPEWLHRLELDVYLPTLGLAFEYQGQQHFRPVELFGGAEAYMKQVERDRLKRELCAQKNMVLIEVYYDEPLSMELILSKIDDAGLPRPSFADLGTEQ